MNEPPVQALTRMKKRLRAQKKELDRLREIERLAREAVDTVCVYECGEPDCDECGVYRKLRAALEAKT